VVKVDIIKEFKVKGEYITLSQFLKEESIISSGGQAKWYLQENSVFLNGVKEKRRGKKIRPDDQVKIADETYKFR
jgi:ribosome-associated protein